MNTNKYIINMLNIIRFQLMQTKATVQFPKLEIKIDNTKCWG